MGPTERWRRSGSPEDTSAPTRTLAVGDLLAGQYEIVRPLGRGGMAQVYQARDLELDRLVAIKVALPWAVDLLHREARLLASLDHPGIVRAYAWGRDAERSYLVLEFIEGESLAERLAARVAERECADLPGLLSVDETLAFGVALCDAVAPLHARAIAHLDLKPPNIMLGPAGRVVLIDLGIACDEGATPPRCTGSPHFIAPEVILDRLRPSNAHLADVYAVGAILFACMAGAPPFADGEPTQVMQRQVARAAPSLAERRHDLPPRLAAVIGETLSRAPGERPQSVEQLKHALLGIPRLRG